MLRITVIQSGPSSKKLKLEGRVAGSSIPELRRLCEAALARNGDARLTLDLADVSFIDDEGISLLRNLGCHNVEVTRCSPFLAELLKEVLPCS
jgi:anti-anti-sigma regulatory factor